MIRGDGQSVRGLLGDADKLNNSRLERWALAAEVVSAAVVVVSIIFLALETRENTKAIHVQTHLALTEQMNQWRAQVNTDEYLSAQQKAYEQGISSMTFPEQRRYMSRELGLWSIYESAFFAFRSGALDQNGWDRFSKNVCQNYSTAVRVDTVENDELMAGGIAGVITDDFRRYLKETCM